MLTDAHCHPADLARLDPEEARRRVALCAASAWNREQFDYHERLAAHIPVVLCFAVHPQLPAARTDVNESFALLEAFAEEGRLGAVGETGVDLYDAANRETEAIQEALFDAHLRIAIEKDLPVVLHVRRAMHRIFARCSLLKKCRAVIFHSWSGTRGEGESLLRRKINAFFSFGNAVMLNHREAMRCCAAFPPERLLVETDAPYQPQRGKPFSSWADLPAILDAVSALRREAGRKDGAGMEDTVERNFREAFGLTRS
jgi:TatD DNase family protein